MNSSISKQIRAYEETQNGSLQWKEERPYAHLHDSGEQTHTNSTTGRDDNSFCRCFENAVNNVCYNENPPHNGSAGGILCNGIRSVLAKDSDRLSNCHNKCENEESKGSFPDSSTSAYYAQQAQKEKSDVGTLEEEAAPTTKTSEVILAEGSSPERPFSRPPNTTAEELVEIHRNYRLESNKEWPVFLPPNMDEDLQNLEHPDPQIRPRYLPLAPPYHLLPNTSFFRRASIKPPPTYSTIGLSPLKRIINRYLISILVDQIKSESDQELTGDGVAKPNHTMRKLETAPVREEMTQGGMQLGYERMRCDYQPEHSKWRKNPRVVVHHLHYGGQVTHYVENNSSDLPGLPPPSHFISFSSQPEGRCATPELYEEAPSEYQQQRTINGFIYAPIEERTADACLETALQSLPSLQSLSHLNTSACNGNFEIVDRASCSEKEFENSEGTTASAFDVVAARRSISLSGGIMSLRFAEKNLSLRPSSQG